MKAVTAFARNNVSPTNQILNSIR